jgi:hypothetical protein
VRFYLHKTLYDDIFQNRNYCLNEELIMLKKFAFYCAAICAAASLLTGCASSKLATGKYEISDSSREDFAVVYENLIFIRVKSPEYAPGSLAYWEWAGKYSVEEDSGIITFDMDRETLRRWNFYFQFIRQRDGISFNDWENQTGHHLVYRTPMLRNSSQTPRPTGSSGVNPVYQDMSK